MTQPNDRGTGSRFAVLAGCHRIWAVPAIHADVTRLESIHDAIQVRLKPRDGIVYLGNMIGVGAYPRETIAEILAFRRSFIARRHAFAADIAFLRGSQEEMWQRLLELQFAPNPAEVLTWMLDRGVGPTLSGYGLAVAQGFAACREGPVAITRWTSSIRATINASPGHGSLITALRRAAHTRGGEMLFVHAGINPEKTLDEQLDTFWWGGSVFLGLPQAYQGFRKVVRGFDQKHRGLQVADYAVSLDRGCGFGGSLACACFDLDGNILESFEA